MVVVDVDVDVVYNEIINIFTIFLCLLCLIYLTYLFNLFYNNNDSVMVVLILEFIFYIQTISFMYY